MPKVDGILETVLYVEDLERSSAFYQRVFGFGVITSGDRLCALRVADRQVLLLCKKGASAQLDSRGHDGEGQLHVAFAIPTAELSAWEHSLQQHGIAVSQKRMWERGGCSLYFRDPDQHIVEVATPGVWPEVY